MTPQEVLWLILKLNVGKIRCNLGWGEILEEDGLPYGVICGSVQWGCPALLSPSSTPLSWGMVPLSRVSPQLLLCVLRSPYALTIPDSSAEPQWKIHPLPIKHLPEAFAVGEWGGGTVYSRRISISGGARCPIESADLIVWRVPTFFATEPTRLSRLHVFSISNLSFPLF